jgi:hypothetical protein
MKKEQKKKEIGTINKGERKYEDKQKKKWRRTNRNKNGRKEKEHKMK